MLKIEKVNDVQVARFENADRFNALITEPVKEKLKSVFNQPGTKLAFSLEGIKFIDSSGFGVFLSAMKTAANSKGQLKLCCISSEVMELFKLLQLHNVFEIHDSIEDCIQSFN
jgi:anti-sigma B factor antagonist